MSVEIHPCSSPEELALALEPIMHYFGGGFTEKDLDRWRRIIDISRMHAARENGATVGGAGAFSFDMSLPGGATVAAGGVTVVGVLPTHRRRGILNAMMRAQLDDIHRRGEPVAWLWASDEMIYRRFGYGMASLCCDIEVPKSMSAYERPFERRGATRLVGEEEALAPFSEIYERVRLDRPGMFSRTVDWWKLRRLEDSDRGRAGGAGVLNRVLLTIDGRPEAYALYRIHQSLHAGVSQGHVNVIEAVGASLEGTREIWRFLFDIDWVASVKAAQLPVDHPLLLLAANPRRLGMCVIDGVWVRLVDVPKALEARVIAPGDPLVIDVSDAFCPWNSGRYRIADGRVAKCDAGPDLSLPVSALGSIYLGGFRFTELARAGVIEERTNGAAARADLLFPRDRAPWCPEIF